MLLFFVPNAPAQTDVNLVKEKCLNRKLKKTFGAKSPKVINIVEMAVDSSGYHGIFRISYSESEDTTKISECVILILDQIPYTSIKYKSRCYAKVMKKIEDKFNDVERIAVVENLPVTGLPDI